MMDTRQLDNILTERERQDEKWGQQDWTDEMWLVILTEEVGELAKAILQQTEDIGGSLSYWKEETRKELVQAIAVGLAWLECMDRRVK